MRVVRFYQSCSPPPRLHCLLRLLTRRLLLAVQIPVGTAGPPPRAPDPSGQSWTSTASSRSQWAQPDLHRELQIPVGTAGPQPRAPDRSGHCRTSTATSRSQWALPDLNRDFQIAVGTAGPQPRLPDRSGHCRTSTGRMSEKMPDRMSEDMPDRMPERMSERMSEDMPDRMSEDIPERMSDRMPEDMPDRMPEDLPDRMLEDMPGDMPEDMPEDMPDRMPEDLPDRMLEDMPDRMPEDMTDRMPEDLPVRKCINAMVGITRSKVIYKFMFQTTNQTVYPWYVHNVHKLGYKPCNFDHRHTFFLGGTATRSCTNSWTTFTLQRFMTKMRTVIGGKMWFLFSLLMGRLKVFRS